MIKMNLPNVIQSVINLSSDVKENTPLEIHDVKRNVICTTRTIKEDDLDVLKFHGKVLDYRHSIHTNVNIMEIDFDYMILDLNQVDDRMYLQKQILTKLDQINLILYKYSFQTDGNLSYTVERSDFPSVQINQSEFNKLLLQRPIQAPSFFGDLLKRLVCVEQ